jgi:hypothetical protein
VAGGAGGDPAAERRALERLRVEAQRHPVLGELLLDPRPGRPGLDARGARDRVDLEYAVEAPEVERHRAVVARVRDRVDAADHARPAAVRGHGEALRVGSLERAEDAGLVVRPHHRVGQVREVAAHGTHDVQVRRAVRVQGAIGVDPQRRGRLELGGAEAQMRRQVGGALADPLVLESPAPVPATPHYPP